MFGRVSIREHDEDLLHAPHPVFTDFQSELGPDPGEMTATDMQTFIYYVA